MSPDAFLSEGFISANFVIIHVFSNMGKISFLEVFSVFTCSVSCYLGKETDPHLTKPFFQVLVESDEMFLKCPFFPG